MKPFRVEDYYSPSFWSHLDAICAVLCFVVFCLVICCISLSGDLNPVSQELTNFTVGKDILVAASVFTTMCFFLLLLPMILKGTSTYFILEEDRQLLYILGRNPPEEKEELIQVSQTVKSKGKLGMEEEGKWSYGSKKSKPFGSNQGKWTFGLEQEESQV